MCSQATRSPGAGGLSSLPPPLQELIRQSAPALERLEKVTFEATITNVDRAVGTMLSHHVTLAASARGVDFVFPEDTIDITLTGSAGQSFGAFAARGVTLRCVGLDERS